MRKLVHCAVLLGPWCQAGAQDCDGNGVDDSVETARSLTFSEPLRFAVSDGAITLAAGDANGDGRPDLAITCTKANAVTLLLSDPTSDQLYREPFELCVGIDPRGVSWARTDEAAAGERVDLLVGSEGRQGEDPGSLRPRLSVLRGRADATFEPDCRPPCAEVQPSLCTVNDFEAFLGEADGIRTLEAADLNRDGRVDVVLGLRRTPGTVVALFNTGNGQFGTPFPLHRGDLRDSRYVALGDLDDDNQIDVVTAGGDLLFGPHRPGIEPLEPQRLAETAREPRGIVLADVAGDARSDIVLVSSLGVAGGAGSGSLTVVENLGDRVFAAIPQPDLDELCDLLESVAAADLDLDGDIDLVLTRLLDAASASCSSSGLEILTNDGEGRFSPGHFLSTDPARARWVLATDLNDDQLADLAVATQRGSEKPDEVLVLINHSRSAEIDRDHNGIPDVCQFLRGDVDGDLRATITDPIVLLGFLFLGGETPGCLEACDVDNDGRIQIADAISLLLHLFQGGPPPAAPGLIAAGSCSWPDAWIDGNGLIGCEVGCGR